MPIDATQPYDDQNIFAKILRGEIPSKRVYDDDFAIAKATKSNVSAFGLDHSFEGRSAFASPFSWAA